ncbi:MAG: DUF805 domain-containing protein [Pseudomonadota bacterium]
MMRDYFLEIFDGRLRPIPFLVRWLALIVLMFGLAIGTGAAIGLTERIVGGDLQALQQELLSSLGGPVVIAVLIAFLAFAFANLNIIAKRARDVGLPGWITAVLIAALSGGASQATGEPTTGGLGLILLIVLALMPTDMMRKGS